MRSEITFHCPLLSRPRSAAIKNNRCWATALLPTSGLRYSSWSKIADCRDKAPRQQPPGAVQVGHDRIQQLSPLHQTGLETCPLAVIKDQWQGVKPPRLWLYQAGRRSGRRTMAVRFVCYRDR